MAYFGGEDPIYSLTIIGNGFDLSLGAKTRYEDFFNCLKSAFESDTSEQFVNSLEHEFVNEDNLSLLSDFFRLVKDAKDNFFVNYFINYNKAFDNWVSFETELTRIIRSFDLMLSLLNDSQSFELLPETFYFHILDEMELMSVIDVYPNNKFFQSETESLHPFDDTGLQDAIIFEICGGKFSNKCETYKTIADFTNSFPKDLYKDLCVFSDLFVSYLLAVENFRNEGIVFGPILDSDFFINYNYTNYLDLMLSSSGCTPLDIIHINGKVSHSSERPHNRIVFGIDSNTELKNVGFDVFTKTIQRSLYETDVCRLSRFLDNNIGLINVYGHSLSLADCESLRYVFDRCEEGGKPTIKIYCLNELAKIEIVNNLRRILGKNRFDAYQRENKLFFPYSKEAIVRKKNKTEGDTDR